MSKNEKNQFPEQEELMDEELLKMGVRFTDLTQPQAGEAVPVADYDLVADEHQGTKATVGKAAKVLASVGSLVAADALLMFMCMADKIELAYGLVFLAAASAFLGARVNNASI